MSGHAANRIVGDKRQTGLLFISAQRGGGMPKEGCFGAYWAAHQLSATVRAPALQLLSHAVNAKGAFE